MHGIGSGKEQWLGLGSPESLQHRSQLSRKGAKLPSVRRGTIWPVTTMTNLAVYCSLLELQP